ncbi:hypothetical protein A2U01_0108395, partial [Trifolium medium]|nr:hypothetical protein [Trifolium medium]
QNQHHYNTPYHHQKQSFRPPFFCELDSFLPAITAETQHPPVSFDHHCATAAEIQFAETYVQDAYQDPV